METCHTFQGAKVGMLGRQNERNSSYFRLAKPLYLVLCLPVYEIKLLLFLFALTVTVPLEHSQDQPIKCFED